MNVVVQHLQSKLYLATDGSWVRLDAKPAGFGNAVKAISFCIKRGFRDVRLVSNPGVEGSETLLYPFGEDPSVKAEKKKLRRALVESRRLKAQKQILLQQLDMVRAEAKEEKKKIPMKRTPVSED